MIRTSILALCAGVAAFAADAVPAVTPAPVTSTESKPVELTTKQKASYLIGANMAGAVKEYDLDVALVVQALQDTVAGKPGLIPKEQAQEVFAKFQAEVDAAKAKLGESRKGDNAKWLADNAKKPGIKVTASGLQYEVVTASTKKDAKKPTAADTVKVNYVGALTDGTVFDVEWVEVTGAAKGPDTFKP